jgi:hypothetical protein
MERMEQVKQVLDAWVCLLFFVSLRCPSLCQLLRPVVPVSVTVNAAQAAASSCAALEGAT